MAKWKEEFLAEVPEPTTKIYLLTCIITGQSYDVVNSMVVRAKNEQEARQEASLKAMDEGKDTWLDNTHSHCERISETGEVQVLCVDASNG